MAQLDLFGHVSVRLPWDGRSPRSLTKAAKALFLKRERQKDDRFFCDPDQLELMLTGNKAPRIYRGAPLLIEPLEE